MSNSKNVELSETKFFESQIRSRSFTNRGLPLTKEDNDLAATMILMWWLVIEGCLFQASGVSVKARFRRWLDAIVLAGIDVTLKVADSATRILLNAEASSYDDFKHRLSVTTPFAGAIIGPAREAIVLALTEDIEGFQASYQVFKFPQRLCLDAEVLETEALEAYLRVDRSLGPPGTMTEKSVISSWFPKDSDPIAAGELEFVCKHGSGSTAEGIVDWVDKFTELGSDYLTNYVFRGLNTDLPQKSFRRVSRTVFVPKSWKARRTISMEPTTLMWLQQGVGNCILEYIADRQHPLSRRYDAMDPVRNRYLAQDGSLDGSFCTIDLSSASDSVSFELVKAWFSDSWLYRYIIACRAPKTELPDGSVYEHRKVSAMGNRLTFLIEVIVFAAIVESAILEVGGKPSRSSYCVYGDDIVVEDLYYEAVVARLERNGFTVNRDKSFHGTNPFRESCGGHYYHGYDVTPLQTSRTFTGVSGSAVTWVPALIDLANSCFGQPMLHLLRRWCISELNRLPTALRPPFSADGRVGLISDQPTNWGLVTGYDNDLQAQWVKCGSVSHASPAYEESANLLLLKEYLRQTRSRSRLLFPEDLAMLPTPAKRRIRKDLPKAKRERWLSTRVYLT